MRRHFILEGDKTTANGEVLEGHGFMTFRGRKAAYHGAKIACPACKSTGMLSCIGPRRPFTLANGQQIGMESDLCLCRCRVPPTLVASQDYAYMDFVSSELARMGFASDGTRLPEDSESAPLSIESGQHSERLLIFNPVTGERAVEDYVFVKSGAVIEKGRAGADGRSKRHLREEGGRLESLIGPSGEWSVEYHDGRVLAPLDASAEEWEQES